MSLSNPAYGTLPAFERPASAGATMGGSGGGAFIPPPPGASMGGEPGQYSSFQQSHPNVFNWPTTQMFQSQPQPQASSYPPSGSGHTQLHQSQHSQLAHFQTQPSHQHYSPYHPPPSQHSPYHPPPSQHSPYHQPPSQHSSYYQPPSQHSPYHPPPSQHSPYHLSQNSPYQTQPSQRVSEPGSTPWTYAQYPPSPELPITAPATTSAFNNTPNATGRYSPYGTQTHSHPPPNSAPAEAPPWSHIVHSHQQTHTPWFSEHSQQQIHQHHDQASSHRPSQGRRHSIGSSGYLPVTNEPTHSAHPLPFNGSANAPPPRKPALKPPNSQSAAGRPIGPGSRHHATRMQQHDSSGSAGSSYGFGMNGSGWPTAIPPTAHPTVTPSAPVIPSMSIPNVPGYTLQDEDNWAPDNLSPRPRDWRADYFPKQGFSMYLARIGRVRSDVVEYTDTVKRSLHPLLHYVPNSEPLTLTFDLRYPIVHGNTLHFSQLQKNFNEVDLAQHAAYPPAPILRLYHPKLPWYVDVHQSHPTGVTVFDVLAQMSLQMQAPIHSRHYYNDVLDLADRSALGRGYKERCRGRLGENKKGVLQVDFIGDKFVFEGLARGKQGLWEIKTSSFL